MTRTGNLKKVGAAAILPILAAAFSPDSVAGGTRTGNSAPMAAVFIRDEPLFSAPEDGGKSVMDLSLGSPAQILDRRGRWYQVASGANQGWVRMFSVRFVPSAGKWGLRTRSAVLGVRGLGEVELKEATPDPRQLELLDSYAADAKGLEGFDRHGYERLRAITVSSSGAGDPEREKLEIRMGREVAAGILGAAPLHDKPEIQRYVNRVGTWVARVSDRPNLPWRFGVVKSDSINAFAAPGGTVLLTLGLYRLLRTESELAGVLAHEIAHVVHGHHMALLLQGKAMEAIAEKTKKMKVSAAPVQAMLHKMVVKGAEVFTRALDRQAEFDSDRMAMILAADAGYDPYGFPRVIQLLGLSTPEEPPAALIFKTHPDPVSRAKQLGEFASGGRVAELRDRVELRKRFEAFSLYGVELGR